MGRGGSKQKCTGKLSYCAINEQWAGVILRPPIWYRIIHL